MAVGEVGAYCFRLGAYCFRIGAVGAYCFCVGAIVFGQKGIVVLVLKSSLVL